MGMNKETESAIIEAIESLKDVTRQYGIIPNGIIERIKTVIKELENILEDEVYHDESLDN